jgi:hypothetical protein
MANKNDWHSAASVLVTMHLMEWMAAIRWWRRPVEGAMIKMEDPS